MNTEKKSNSQKYWREFERLSLSLIKDQFNMIPLSLRLTPSSTDGGFDGEGTFNLSPENQLNLSFKVLMEAKLREENNGLGLRAFAATLVVAHNNAAHALIITTNRLYSPQAISEVAKFVAATRMEVRLIDGAAVNDWVSSNILSLQAQNYSINFLKWLQNNCVVQRKSRQFELILDSKTSPKTQIAKLEINSDGKGNLSNCQIIVTESLRPPIPLVGIFRNDLLKKLIFYLNESSGTIVLEGGAGSGKSLILKHVIFQAEGRRNIGKIDLTNIQSPKNLFLTIFELLTGIKLASILTENYDDEEGISNLLHCALGKNKEEQYIKSVSKVVLASDKNFELHKDLNKHFLSKYLGLIAECQSRLNGFLIIFENLNRATSEVLNFLTSVIDELDAFGIVVIELRTDGDAQKTSPADWNCFKDVFRKKSTSALLTVPNLSKLEGIALVNYWLPNLGMKRAGVILDRVGLSPLLIEISCLWLLRSNIAIAVADNSIVIQKLEEFFEGISPNRAVAVIRNLLGYWIKEESEIYKYAIICSGLLLGKINVKWLSLMFDGLDENRIAEDLLQTGVFEIDGANSNFLKLKHDLLVECCENLLYEFEPMTRIIATKFMEIIGKILKNGDFLPIQSARILFFSGKFLDAYVLAKKSATEYLHSGQLSDASSMWDIAYKTAERIFDYTPVRDSMIVDALYGNLIVEKKRNRLQLGRNQGKLAALETHINLSENFFSDIEWKVKVGLLRWKGLFVLEKFDEANGVVNELNSISISQPKEIQAEIMKAQALTYKGLGMRKEAQLQFDLAVEQFPEIKFLQRDRLSNIASTNLTKEPKVSLGLYLEMMNLLEVDAAKDINEYLHLSVDIAMANFLSGRYDQALSVAESACQSALSNSFETEEARARNIAACCHWVYGRTNIAMQQIELGVLAAERSFYYRYLWRIRVNAAGIALDFGDKKTALQHACAAFKMIIEPRKKIMGYFKNKSERWYVAILAILIVIKNCQRQDIIEDLLGNTSIPGIFEDFELISSGSWPEYIFQNTKHIHENKIMITG